jgi:hypothetical protein
VHDDFFVGRRVHDLTALNRQCPTWCTEGNRPPLGTTGVPAVVRWHTEPPALLPLPSHAWDPLPVESRLVQRDGFIAYGATRDSVPHRYVGQQVI